MTDRAFKLGVLKLGCIGATPLLELLLDERADRDDLETRAFTSGAKLDHAACAGPTADCITFGADLVLLVSPNAALPGPSKARDALLAAGIATIVIGDAPSKKAFLKNNEEGQPVKQVVANLGFIILPADAMIGARREFLDPSEMAVFNADVIKVLAACGVLRAVQNEVDRVIESMKSGAEPVLPGLIVSAELAIAAAEFGNPYAAAKAYAALTIAEAVASVTTRGCFVEQDPARYITLVSAGHEMMRSAALLADAAREIEKNNDSVLRTPHAASGQARRKTGLGDKPA